MIKRLLISMVLLGVVANSQCKFEQIVPFIEGESTEEFFKRKKLFIQREKQKLIEAIQKGYLKGVQAWLQKNNPNVALTDQLDAALHFAVANNKIAIINLLIKKGARPNLQNEEGITPLHLAVQNNKIAIIKLLIKKGGYPNKQNKKGVTPLHFAAKNLSLEAVQTLIDWEANPMISDYEEEQTPLHYLAEVLTFGIIPRQEDSVAITNLLLMKNLDLLNREDLDGKTALTLAGESHNKKLEELLDQYREALEKLIPIQDQQKKLNQTLRNAARDGNYILVKLALKYGADKTAKSNVKRQTAYNLAIKNGHTDIAKLVKP